MAPPLTKLICEGVINCSVCTDRAARLEVDAITADQPHMVNKQSVVQCDLASSKQCISNNDYGNKNSTLVCVKTRTLHFCKRCSVYTRVKLYVVNYTFPAVATEYMLEKKKSVVISHGIDFYSHTIGCNKD